MQIPVFKPSLKRKEMHSVLSCLVSDKIGPGEVSSRLVKEFTAYLNLDNGYIFRSYFPALMLLFSCFDLNKTGRVFLSALTPLVYYQFFKTYGINPVVIDVEADRAVIDLQSLEEAAPTADDILILHHPLALIPDMERLKKLKLAIIEDISQSFASKKESTLLGQYGDFTLFSLEEDGIITTGGGVAFLSGNRKNSSLMKKKFQFFGYDNLLSDMNASLGLIQMKNLDDFIVKRQEIYKLYLQALFKSQHKTFVYNEEDNIVPYSFPVIVDLGLKEVKAYAERKGIAVKFAFSDTIIADEEFDAVASCPNARSLALRTLLFPLYPFITKENINKITRVLGTLP